MRTHVPAGRQTRQSIDPVARSGGASAAEMAPPAYGIDFVDAGLGVVQRKLTSEGTYTDAALPPEAGQPGVKQNVGGTQPLTGSPHGVKIFSEKEKPQTDAVDLKGMQPFRDAWLLTDPSRLKVATLTRMHVINGTFSHADGKNEGPGNMVLGTGSSNNSSPNSHLNLVEKPIRNFLRNEKGRKGVLYEVQPDYSAMPAYMQARADADAKANPARNFSAWAAQGCPKSLRCTATFYKHKSGTPGAYQSLGPQTEVVAADIGAPGGVLGSIAAPIVSAATVAPLSHAVSGAMGGGSIGETVSGFVGGAAELLSSVVNPVTSAGSYLLGGLRARLGI